MYRQFNIQNSTFCPHIVFVCFVWIWEQTAIISLYSINWLVCITVTECVYCAVRTGYLNEIWVICFIWIWEQTAIISLYSINWLVCITETGRVYCAVRTGYLNVIHNTFNFQRIKDVIRKAISRWWDRWFVRNKDLTAPISKYCTVQYQLHRRISTYKVVAYILTWPVHLTPCSILRKMYRMEQALKSYYTWCHLTFSHSASLSQIH